MMKKKYTYVHNENNDFCLCIFFQVFNKTKNAIYEHARILLGFSSFGIYLFLISFLNAFLHLLHIIHFLWFFFFNSSSSAMMVICKAKS